MKLLEDLYIAYYGARRNKRNKIEQLEFELNLEDNLLKLYRQLKNRSYVQGNNAVFIINHPVKREIFAAPFADRVIHHLYYNYVSGIFERTFITDSYSCRKGKGTMYGIKRLDHHLRSCSENYKKDCYVLKLDISGYFMSINRDLLLKMVLQTLNHYRNYLNSGGINNETETDYDLLEYLSRVLIDKDPVKDCVLRCDSNKWTGLPRDKSLFTAQTGCGLPIGNLTSQLFSNVYLNEFDQYVKRDLKIKHYGRYVDDFYLIHGSKTELKNLIPRIKTFLADRLKLTLHPKKIYLQHIARGVPYLGVFIKPHRIYIQKRTIKGLRKTLRKGCEALPDDIDGIRQSINSYMGLMKHYKTKKIRRSLLRKYCGIFRYGSISADIERFRADENNIYRK